jgi:glycosyltransferase involved in cell wall biosynthesis
MILTPDMKGGSFLATVQPLQEAKVRDLMVVSLGGSQTRQKGFQSCITFGNYLDYRRLGPLLARNPMAALLYNFPLLVIGPVLAILYRPKTVISNGIVAGLSVLPLRRALGSRFILSHNGQLEFYISPSLSRLLKNTIAREFDWVVVNSKGSAQDVRSLVPHQRIITVEQFPPAVFFGQRDRENLRARFGVGGRLVVLYVGWLNREKRCDRLLSLVDACSDEDPIVFWFVGDGPLKSEVLKRVRQRRTVKYYQYVENQGLLAELYTAADIVWAIADETYVARTGIEALACGTPIVTPSTPGVAKKAAEGLKVPGNLIPATIGWVVDDGNPREVKELLLGRFTSGVLTAMRSDCRKYAFERHSIRNAEKYLQVVTS